MKQNYIYQVKEFVSDLRQIRKAFGIDSSDIKSEVEILRYNKYLTDNEKITEKLNSTMNESGHKMLFLAQTGSGKTHAFFNADTADNVYTFMFTPFKKQSLQNAYKYEVKSITAGNEISPEDFTKNRKFSVVYDKADSVISILNAELLKGNLNNTIINIVVDEVQMLTSAQFRRLALKKLNKLFKVLEKGAEKGVKKEIKKDDPDWLKQALEATNKQVELNYNYNIIYTTATFRNCALLDFNEITVCNSDAKSNINKVEVVNCGGDAKSKDFVAHEVQKELKKNNKVILRLNNKDTIANLREAFTQKGYTCEVLTSDEKEESALYECIIHRGQLTKNWDILFVTSIIDAGVTLDSFEDGTTIKSITPIFLLDALNNNLDDCKQFSNRIRFNYDTFKILVDKAPQAEEVEEFSGFTHGETKEKFRSLLDITKEKAAIYMRYKIDYENIANALFNIYKDREMVTRTVKNILQEKDYFGRKNDFGGLYDIYNAKIQFAQSDAWNRIYSEYMSQMLTFRENRLSYIDTMFDCKIQESTTWQQDIQEEYIDYTKVKFDNFIEQAKNDSELRQKITKKEFDKIEGIDDIKRDKRYEKFLRILELKENVFIAINDLSECNTPQKLNKTIRKYERDILEDLTQEQIKKIDLYNKTKEEKVLDYDTLKIANGEYKEIFEDLYRLKIKAQDAIKLILNRDMAGVKKWIIEEQTIQNNKKIEAGEKAIGRSAAIQATLITLINTVRGPVSTLTLDQRDLEMLAQKMTYFTKTKFTRNTVTEALRLTFTYYEREIATKNKKKKETQITIKDLRKNHIK